VALARDENRLRRRPARTYDNSMIDCIEVWWLRSLVLGHRAFWCAAAGPAARSGARTGPARRPAAAAEGRT
jgi:hypothetical protein